MKRILITFTLLILSLPFTLNMLKVSLNKLKEQSKMNWTRLEAMTD